MRASPGKVSKLFIVWFFTERLQLKIKYKTRVENLWINGIFVF